MRCLVVGLGSMGRRRLRNLTHLGGHELFGFEPQAERAAAVAAEFGIPVSTSFEEALQAEPEALVVSTPPDLHHEYALHAATHGLPFFTEASVVSAGMEELIAETRSRGGVGCPSCTMRFHPAVQVLRDRLASGDLGKPLAVVHHCGQYLPDWHPWEDYRTFYVARRETGAAREIVPFELSWLTGLLGSVEAISGLRGKVSDLEVDIDDVYVASLRFSGGALGALVIDALSRPATRRARIVCAEGTLIWDWQDGGVREWTAVSDAWVEHPDPPPVEGPGGTWVAENMYIEEMRAFTRAATGEAPWPFSLEEDLELLRLTEAIETSSDAASRA